MLSSLTASPRLPLQLPWSEDRRSFGKRLPRFRFVESTIQGFEERATKIEADVLDCHKRAKELEGKIGAPFEHEKRYQELTVRQGEIEEKLDRTKNQAPSQADTEPAEINEEKNSEANRVREATKRRVTMRV